MRKISFYFWSLFVPASLLLLGSCGSYNSQRGNGGLQNFTVRYNILFNARTILEQVEHSLEANYFDNFDQLLPVYKPLGGGLLPYQLKQLDSVVQKSNRIILEKSKSDYIPEAYFMLGEVNELKGYYFQAAEYYRYVFRYLYEKPDLALTAKTRETSVLWRIGLDSLAKNGLDSALKYTSRTTQARAAIYATQAAAYIRDKDYIKAIGSLELAIKQKPAKASRLRWTFLSAQLLELTNQPVAARLRYSQLKGNTLPFDLVLNATLRELALSDTSESQKESQILALKKMLSKALYEAYYDQIYYRLGNVYSQIGETNQARNAYVLSTNHYSSKNKTLKGLGYLKLSEGYFQEGEYKQAASAFDSTLQFLPNSHPERQTVEKKSLYLMELAQLHKAVRTADSLKRFALLSTEAQIQVKDSLQRTAALASTRKLNKNFYFNNERAIAQGRENFVKRWGNRALQDNWRTENSVVSLALPKVSESAIADASTAPMIHTNTDSLRRNNVVEANERLAKSWYNLYSFYRSPLKSEQAAINSLKSLLAQAPASSYQAEAYYLLQSLLAKTDTGESKNYRKLLLQDYPASSFALALNPATQQSKERLAQLNQHYTSLYHTFKEKKYSQVIRGVDEIEQSFGQHYLSAQFAYLKLLAIGYTQPIVPFEELLNSFVHRYPNDALISPLLKEHQEFIRQHRAMMEGRTTALLEDNGINLLLAEIPEEISRSNTSTIGWKAPALSSKPFSGTLPSTQIASLEEPQRKLWADSGMYYYVVNVNSVNLDIGPSRFSLRQFLRNYEDKTAILGANEEINSQNTLLIIGPFPSFERVKRLEQTINPVINEIMKLASERYNTFVIEKKDIQQLKDRQTITDYVEFYKNNK